MVKNTTTGARDAVGGRAEHPSSGKRWPYLLERRVFSAVAFRSQQKWMAVCRSRNNRKPSASQISFSSKLSSEMDLVDGVPARALSPSGEH